VHVVAVVGCEPHEVGRRCRVQVIDKGAVCHRAIGGRISSNYVVAPRRVVQNVVEEDERVVFISVGFLVGCDVAAAR
jgi:hypothetical protein